MADDVLTPEEKAEKRRARGREYDRKRRIEQSEIIKERKRRYYETYKDKLSEKYKQYYKDNKETIIQKAAIYAKENAERAREYKRSYEDRNRDKNNKRLRKYTADNPERQQATKAKSRLKNIEKRRAYGRQYSKENRIKRRPQNRAYCSMRHKRVRRQTPVWADMRAMFDIYMNVPKGFQVDHIIPITGLTLEGYRVSGLHIAENLQYLTEQENLTKRNRMRPEDHAIAENTS